jgi:hypothetical protein
MRFRLFVFVLMVVLAAFAGLVMMPPCVAASRKPNDVDLSPLSYREYVRRTDLHQRIGSDFTNIESCKESAKRWTLAARGSYKLTDEQASRLTDLVAEKELASLANYVVIQDYANQLSLPLAGGSFDRPRARSMLFSYFVSTAYVSVQGAKYWREIRDVIGTSSDLAKWPVQRVSLCTKTGNQPGVPGLWRIRERSKYAEFLSPASSQAQLQKLVKETLDRMRPSMSKLDFLAERMDELEDAKPLVENALRAVALQVAHTQTEIGMIGLEAEWEMLKVVPQEFQGTWASIPVLYHIPDSRPVLAPLATPGKRTIEP